MTSEHHSKQLLTNWLEDQPATAPDRLLDAVLRDVGQTPQRGHLMATVRSLPMFSQNAVRLYGVAAVVLLVVVVAFAWWPRQQAVGPIGPSTSPGTPSASPTSSPTGSPTSTTPGVVTPSPSPTELPPAGPQWVRWELNPPGFFVHASIDSLDYRSPGNWGREQIGSTFAVIYNNTGATYDTLNITTGAAPYTDPCAVASDRSLVEVGPSVDELVQGLAKIKVNVSTVTDTAVAGFPAKQLTFTAPEPRPGCENGEFQLWQWPDPFAERAPVGPVGETTVYVVDVAGTRVMVTIEDRGTAEDSVLLLHMLNSLQLAPDPESAVTPDPSAYVIRGRITMSDGAPVGYAQVEALCTGCGWNVTWTNADGTYEIVLDESVKELDSPMVNLLCHPVAGYFDNSFWFGPSGWSWSRPVWRTGESFQVGPVPTVVDVTLPAAVEVSGTVVTDQGQPLSGIQVGFDNSGEPTTPGHILNRSTYTDSDGRFRFLMLPGSGNTVGIGAEADQMVGFDAVVTVWEEPIKDIVITLYPRP